MTIGDWMHLYLGKIVGSIFLLIGAYKTGAQYLFLRQAKFTVGRLKQWTQDDEYMWHPIVAFSTFDGREIEFTSGVGCTIKFRWEAGHPLDVIYDAAKPESAQIYRFMYFWLLPLGFLIGGFVMLFIPYDN